MILEIIIVLSAGLVLGASLVISLWLVRSIKGSSVTEKWLMLQVLLFIVAVFYVIILLDFLQFGIDTFISIELLASLTLFLMSLYVGGATYLSWRTLRGIYGNAMSNKAAVKKFVRYASLTIDAVDTLKDKSFDMKCEVCERKIDYTIADVVRSHPDLERGVEIEDGLGELNFTLYVRHDCNDHYRETPIQHDHNMVPRAQKESREVVKI